MRKTKESEATKPKEKERYQQLRRLFKLLNLMETRYTRGLTVNKALEELLACGFRIKKRTIYRDFEVIRTLGFQLTEEKDSSGDTGATIFSLDRTCKFSEYLAIEQKELIALYLARQTLTPLSKTPFYEDLKKLFEKLDAKIGEKGRECLLELGKEIHFNPGPVWGLNIDAQTVDTLHFAISEGHQIFCSYDSANSGEKAKRTLGPQVLYFAKGALYLLAEDLTAAKVKVFSLSRMSDVECLDAAYEGERTDPEEFFANSIGVFRNEGSPEKVRILFSGPGSAWVKDRSWHHSQRVVNRSGGSFEIHLEVMLTPELVNTVLGFGPGAEVLEPESLREEISEAAEKIAQKAKRGAKEAA